MTKLFKNDLFLPHDSVVKAGSGAQFCGDIHYMLLHFGGEGVQVISMILHVILFVHVPLFKKKKHYWETKVLHYIPLGPLLFTGSGQFREKTLVGFYTKSSSMSDNSIYERFGIGLDNPT